MTYKIGIDVGGTFTDLVAVDEDTGRLITAKAPTTPEDQSSGLMDAVSATGIAGKDVTSIIHGCTVAINAVLTRTGVKTGLLTTEGFRDVLVMGRGQRPSVAQFDPRWRRSFSDSMSPLAPRYLRRTVSERVDCDGRVFIPLDTEEAARELSFLRKCGVEALAICLLNSYISPQHEQRLSQMARELLPQTYISVSSDVHPAFKEFPRLSTCVLNAYVGPVMDRYLSHTEERLQEFGYKGGLLVMQSNGGLIVSSVVRERPVYTVQSGPVGGAVAARYMGELTGVSNLIAVDIGGTSCDVTIITDGSNTVTPELEIEHDLMVALPSIQVKSVGAGAGSIAWIDHLGALKVGPQSAGAVPGPACYGRGGDKATVTDALVIMGTLVPEHFLGGDMKIYPELAERALEPLAQHFGFSLAETGKAICDVLVANVSEAAKEISLYSGIDPGDYQMLAYGSAGPLFASEVGRELGVKGVIVPPFPGEMCAFGLVISDLRLDWGESVVKSLDSLSPEELAGVYGRLESRVLEMFQRQSVAPEKVVLSRYFDGRYFGQTWDTYSVPAPSGEVDAARVEQMKQNFHREHQRAWGYCLPTYQVKLIMARVSGTVARDKPRLQPIESGGESPQDALLGKVKVYMERGSQSSVPLYQRERLRAGNRVRGPAIIQQRTSTTVLLPGDDTQVDTYGNLRITWG